MVVELFRLAQDKKLGNLMLFNRIDCNRFKLNLNRLRVLPLSLSLLASLFESPVMPPVPLDGDPAIEGAEDPLAELSIEFGIELAIIGTPACFIIIGKYG